MAQIEFATNDPLTVKQWSEGTDAEVLKKVSWFKYVGKKSTALLQWKDQLEKAPGDTITFGLRMQLNEAPRTEGETLEGNEQSLRYFDHSITINECVDAVRFNRKMSAQRVAHDLRSDAKDGVSDQLANALDTSFFNQIAGYNPAAGVEPTFRGNNDVVGPDAEHLIIAKGVATEELLDGDATDTEMKLDLIDICVERAKTLTPAIRPAKLDFMGGRELYVMFLHPYQITQLRKQDSRFDVVQRAVLSGGEHEYNPLFTGNTVEWNGVLVTESSRIPNGINAGGTDATNVRRGVFCGAQAAAVGWGREDAGGGPQGRYTWVEETFDYGREKGVSAGCIVGMKKNVFDNKDFATIVVSTHSPMTVPS